MIGCLYPRSTRPSRRSRGQALVEFALVAPILFLLIFALIEFGRFVFAYEVMNNATREGARYAIVHGSDSRCPSGEMPGGIDSLSGCWDETGQAVADHVRGFAFVIGLSADFVANLPVYSDRTGNPGGDNNGRGHLVTVSADYTFRTIIPLPIPPIEMHSEATLVVNH